MGNEHLQSLEAQYLSKMIEGLTETQKKLSEQIDEYREALAALMLRIEKRITMLEVRSSILWGLLGVGTGSGATLAFIKTFGEKLVAN